MSERKIPPETIITRKTDIITADMEGEKAMMSIERGKYYGLNEVGSCIWQLLDQPVTMEELIGKLMKEYQVDEITCERDVAFFLRKMCQEGLVSLD